MGRRCSGGGGWWKWKSRRQRGNREDNGAEALQIEQPHQSLKNQLPIPSQSLTARQMVSQSIALPSATGRWQPQQLQQQQLESNPQTQQQQPRAMNLADGGYSAGENEEAIHYGHGFEEYRNNLLGGAQARGRRGESYSEDGVLTDKKRGRRQGPETSAFDRRKGGGRSGANSKRCKASRREAGQGERSRGSCSPSRSDSRPRRSNPDTANAPSAAEPESPDPSQLAVSRQPLALSADLVSPVASWTFQKGEAAPLTTRVPPPWPPVPPRPLLLPLRSEPKQLEQRKRQRRHT